MNCESCGMPGADPISTDPHDPWWLCPWCQNALLDELDEATRGPMFDPAEVDQMLRNHDRRG